MPKRANLARSQPIRGLNKLMRLAYTQWRILNLPSSKPTERISHPLSAPVHGSFLPHLVNAFDSCLVAVFLSHRIDAWNLLRGADVWVEFGIYGVHLPIARPLESAIGQSYGRRPGPWKLFAVSIDFPVSV